MKQRGNSPTQAIKARLSLGELAGRYVELRRVGGRLMAPCPFHQETKPSFSINDEEGFFYCFGCQASGDIFDFYGRMHGLEFRETLEALAEEAGISLEDAPRRDPNAQREQSFKRQCLRMHELAQLHFAANLKKAQSAKCTAYIEERGLTPEVLETFGIGYSLPEWQSLSDALRRGGFSPDLGAQSGLLSKNEAGRIYDRFRGRLMFPIKDLSGRVIAFGGRILEDGDEAKYINSSDSIIYKKGDHLYGLYQARRAISQHARLILTEGYMDVITLHQFGYRHACGVLGTALTPEQVKRISGFSAKVDLLFDGDKPGRKAAMRGCEMLLTRGLKCRVALLPDGEDIDSFLRSRGKEAFDRLLEAAPDGMDFCISVLNAEYAPTEAMDWTKKFLGQMAHQPELVAFFLSRLARGLGINEADLREGMAPVTRRAPLIEAPATTAPVTTEDAHSRRDHHIVAFAVRYPHHFAKMLEAGVALMLRNPLAAALCEKMQQNSPELDVLMPHLNEEERGFCMRACAGESLPRDKELLELEEILASIQKIVRRELGGASARAALGRMAGAADPDTEIELLRALQEQLKESYDD